MMKNFIYKLLKHSGKYTQTDMVYLAKGGFWLSAGQAVSAVSAFIMAIVFAKLLPKEVYGDYKYILSIAALLTIFTLPGTNISLTQAVAKGEAVSMSKLTLSKIKFGLIASLISLIIAAYYFITDNYIFTVAFVIVAILVPIVESLTLYASVLNGRQLFRKLTERNSLVKIIHSALIITVVWFTQNIIVIITIYFLSILALRWTVTWLTSQEIKDDKNSSKDIDSYGRQLSLAQSVNTISSQIDKILVYYFLGPIQLAIYFMAVTPVDQVKQIVKNIVPLTLPRLSQRSAKELDNSLNKKLIMTGLLGILLTALYIMAAPIFYSYFVPEYIASTAFSILFSSMILLQALSSIIASVLRAQKMVKIIHQNAISQNISLIVLMAVLGFFYGITGIILAKIISMIISIILRWSLWKRQVSLTG